MSEAHAPNRRLYWIVFGWLFALTVLEVVIALPAPRAVLGQTLVAASLIGLAIWKASFVGLFYMHLSHETSVLKLTVAIPMAIPAFYALVLVGEAAWRIANGQLQGVFP